MKRNTFNRWLLLPLTAILTLSGCITDDDISTTPDDIGEIGKKSDMALKLGAAQEAIVNEKDTTAQINGCFITLNPTIVEGDTRITLTPATQTPYLISEGDQGNAVDVRLEGNDDELTGIMKIHIFVETEGDRVPVAARYDEKEKDWVPVDYEYNRSRSEVVIFTDRPGTYGAFSVDRSSAEAAKTRAGSDVTFGSFIVARANTRAAGLYQDRFSYITWDDDPILVSHAILDYLIARDAPDTQIADWAAEHIADHKTLGIDITYNLMKTMGFSHPFLNQYAERLGRLCIVGNFYQQLRAIAQGDYDKADGLAIKGLLDIFVGKASSLCKSAGMNLAMAGVAFIDYSINKFAETAWSGRQDMYQKAFDLYYSKGHEGYRSLKQWYNLFWPAFTKDGMTEMRLNALIDAYVNKYCEQFWENEETVAYYLSQATGTVWTGGGGINERIKKELSAELRGILYNDVLPTVFDAIGNKMRQKSYDLMKDEMMKYAYHMNSIITLEFRDKSANGGKSAYAGHTVKFKKLPISLLDPYYWECKLDDKGRGQIKFRLFAYAATGVKPQMVIVSPEGKEVLNITLKDISLDKNIIEYEPEEETDVRTDISTVGITFSCKHNGSERAYNNNFDLYKKDIKVTKNGNSLHIDGHRKTRDNHYAIDFEYKLSMDIKIGKDGFQEVTQLKIEYLREFINIDLRDSYILEAGGIPKQSLTELSNNLYGSWAAKERDGLKISQFEYKGIAESHMNGKMTKVPFSHSYVRADDNSVSVSIVWRDEE